MKNYFEKEAQRILAQELEKIEFDEIQEIFTTAVMRKMTAKSIRARLGNDGDNEVEAIITHLKEMFEHTKQIMRLKDKLDKERAIKTEIMTIVDVLVEFELEGDKTRDANRKILELLLDRCIDLKVSLNSGGVAV